MFRRLSRLLQEYCLKYIVKESNWNQIVMSKDFETLEQPLMVQIIRRRELPPVKSLLEPRQWDNINSASRLLVPRFRSPDTDETISSDVFVG